MLQFYTGNGRDTITPLNSYYADRIGKAPTLSFRDIELIHNMYNCTGMSVFTTKYAQQNTNLILLSIASKL